MLQTKRIKYYRTETDPTCLLCGAAEENVPHLILQCEKLQLERVALLSEINAIWQNEFQNNENFTNLSEVDQLQLLMDNTIKVKPTKKNSASVARLEGGSVKSVARTRTRTGNLLLLISPLILRCFAKTFSFIVYFYILETHRL